LVALDEARQARPVDVEPGRGGVRGLADLELETAQLQEVRGGREAEVQIHLIFEAWDELVVQQPATGGVPFDAERHGSFADPAPHAARFGVPASIAADLVVEAGGSPAVVLEDRRAL